MSSEAAAESALFWGPLIQYIKAGRVVPVVGQDLLTLRMEGRQVPLYQYLAERLAAMLRVSGEDLPACGALNTVACRHLKAGGDLDDVYSGLKEILDGAGDLPIPEPLLQLAEITPFRLFVTTTFDPFLARALDQVRFGGKETTRTYAYSPESAEDLTCAAQELDQPAVFHLFGKLSSLPSYAVTEEDMLEFIHHLQSETRRPHLLFDELTNRHLLLIGCNFGDWLARFFIRIAKPARLYQVPGKTDFVADSRVREDSGLVLFLQSFKTRTKVFQEGGAAELVAELAARWKASQPRQPAAEPAGEPSEIAEVKPGAVFLSYPSEDLPAAEALRDSLERAGVDVWFDKKGLEAGDHYEDKILSCIESCSLFVPVISRHALTPQGRFFRLEWKQAERVAGLKPDSTTFILPVAVDETSPTAQAVPESFRRIHWTRLPEGKTTPEFVATVRKHFREYQKYLEGPR
ncbi:MAG TPA: toll/interleukin-1 receptor domain-containing protein [Thermoanaerobaculia bacterium]